MASEGTTSLAPPQGVAANGAEGAPPESRAPSQGVGGDGADVASIGASIGALILAAGLAVRFTLRWPSGAVVGEFRKTGIAEFIEDLVEGRIQGVTRARNPIDDGDENCVFGHYVLLWGTTELQFQDGQWLWFCDYGMHDGSEVTLLLRRPTDPDGIAFWASLVRDVCTSPIAVSDLSLASFAAAFDLAFRGRASASSFFVLAPPHDHIGRHLAMDTS